MRNRDNRIVEIKIPASLHALVVLVVKEDVIPVPGYALQGGLNCAIRSELNVLVSAYFGVSRYSHSYVCVNQ